MALITDPDVLSGNSIQISADAGTIYLSAVESLTTDGVTIKCVYSKLKELWKANETYIKYPFPMTPITDEQFELVNGWNWANNETRYLLRTGGWAVKDAGGTSTEEWAGVITLGTLGSGDQVYFQQGAAGLAGSGAANFQLSGAVNQAVKVYTQGGDDFRSYLSLFCREWGKSYVSSQLSDIGVTTMSYQAYRFPLANAADIKVSAPFSAMSAAPYSGMSLYWYTSPESRTIGASSSNFHVVLSANTSGDNAEQIYEFVQYKLHKDSTTDVDSGAGIKIGNVTPTLLTFVGDTLYTKFFPNTPSGGTYIDNFENDDINRIIFVNDDNHNAQFPYTSSLTLNFGENLTNDVWSKYWVYFTDVPNGNYGDDDAILVEDASSVVMTGVCSGVSSVQRTFSYDSNSQGGRTPATDADITAVAIGLSSAQFVKATGTIERSTANSISLVAPLERNYANPA